ncbi:YbbC/YhhH family protein [Chryseobacterium culicis]|uniref:YbbC/YhhH family protein n=1 Tax=Chryseobacterium culicis TaxID=680127 RepID=UPI001873F7CD|nr:YbbC/YhhH family protein [Chryseobacterium culicis]MBE4948323.1 YbbC/YhhH family protein [Chryseobacterium culicis]
MRKRNNTQNVIGIIHIMSILFLGLSNFNCSSMKNDNKDIKKEVTMTTIDYVPDGETAKRIAEAIWLPIYGEDIYKQKPYLSSLSGDSIWVVKGTLPKNYRGGVVYIEIRKRDCKILKVTHGK